MSEKPINPWVAHCQAYAKQHGCSYKVAIKEAGATYKRITAPKPPKPVAEPIPEPVADSVADDFQLLEISQHEGKLAKLKRPPSKKKKKEEMKQ